jgi:hypothetical protein
MTPLLIWIVFILVIVGAVAIGVGIETWLSPRWGVVARIVGLSVTLLLCFVVAAALGVPGAR